MPAWLKLLHKKRGSRTTVPQLAGSLGEALLSAALTQVGAVLLVWVITDSMARLARNESFPSIWPLALVALAAGACLAIGSWRMIVLMIRYSTTVERRSAFVGQALAMERRRRAPTTSRFPNVPAEFDLCNSPGTRLRFRLPAVGRDIWLMLNWGLVALLLSMITSGLLALAIQDWNWSAGKIVMAVTGLVLGAAAGFCVWRFIKYLIDWNQCGPTCFEISNLPLIPGQKVDVFVGQTGRMRLRKIEFALECVEVAVFQQGTDVRRETQVVSHWPIFSEDRVEISSRKPWEQWGTMQIPSTAMHSFVASSNAIQWRLVLRAKGVNCPELVREAPVVVFPSDESTLA